MSLNREYLERRERESVAAARKAASIEAMVTHTRFAQLYRSALDGLEFNPQLRSRVGDGDLKIKMAAAPLS